MPKGRTVRPTHKTTKKAIKVAAEKLVASTRRNGTIKKSELADAYARVINTKGVDAKEVKTTALAAAEQAVALHPQVVEHRGGLKWHSVGRGNRAAVA